MLESELVQQIMRWDMAVLRESPWYQEIVNEGIKKEILNSIELGLELKFGASGLEILPEISQITDLDVLKQIRQALRSVESLEELRHIYQ